MAVVKWKCNSIDAPNIDPTVLQWPTNRNFSGLKPSDLRTQRLTDHNRRFDIAVIGGGPVGLSIAANILNALPDVSLAIFDEHEFLLQDLSSGIKFLDQRVMRSSFEHNLAPDGCLQLVDFARLHANLLLKEELNEIPLALSHQRSVVAADLFLAHSCHVCKTFRLNQRAYNWKVDELGPSLNEVGWIQLNGTDNTFVLCRNVVIATGMKRARDRRLEIYVSNLEKISIVHDWATWQSSGHGHSRETTGNVAVIGGGLSAGHLILNSVKAKNRVVWVLRGEELYQCADFATSYFRSEGIASFTRMSPPERMATLESNSHGSLMLEFLEPLRSLEASGHIQVLRNCDRCSLYENGDTLTLGACDAEWPLDHAYVATGREIRDDFSFSSSPVNESTLELEGFPGVYVAGPLAAPILGPAARVIDGGRLASQRIVPSLLNKFSTKRACSLKRITGTKAVGL
jgi:hypothetical protein